MNNDVCISQTYSNDNVKTSRLHDTHIVMNKGEINNTGESSPRFLCRLTALMKLLVAEVRDSSVV
jgi:hypothetical protein